MYTVLGISLAAAGFLLWAAAYLYFRRCIKPLRLGERRENDPNLPPAHKKRLRTYNTMLAVACILAVAGCLITLLVRFL